MGAMRDRGSASVELVVLTPMIMMLVLFIVHGGRVGTVAEQLRHAADQGARAASLVSAARQSSAARAAVMADLQRNGVGCADPTVRVVDSWTGRVRTVRVTVSCRIDSVGLALLGAASRRVSTSSTEAIDVYRGGA